MQTVDFGQKDDLNVTCPLLLLAFYNNFFKTKNRVQRYRMQA